MRELPKVYEPQQYEDAIYKKWEESGLFNPDVCVEKGVTTSDAEPFSIVLPPPNVTGTLHMGHAAMLAIEDVMVRYHRMKGDKTLWVPGTDHAAIATQSKVEKMILEKEGKTKYDLGREEFLKRVEEFAQESHDTIVNQCKKMGASLDWSREAYTLDEKRNLAVRTVFKKMYEDGLIYRGYRVINWSVKGQSTISDDEIIYVERPAKLYYFKYSKDFPITIATTRPETKLGDTAVAVNPKDKRYKKYIGKEFTVDLGTDAPLKIKIIADDSVDANFGTGALGVTPAHSAVDFEIYQKQKAAGNDIGLIQVIGEDGKMTLMAGMYAYAGLPVLEAREKFVNYLRENDLLEKEEDITQNVGTSDRFGDIIEPLPKTQWFVDVSKKIKDRGNKTLKQLMQEAVRDKKIEIVPDRFEKTYFHWIDNLRDWCISRQLWYGHQIPSYYNITDPKNHTAFLYYKGGIIATDQIQNKLSEIASQFLTTGERQKKLHEFVWFSNSDRSVCGLTFRMAYELVKSGIVGWQDLKYYSAIDTQCVATAESYIDRPAEEFYFQDLDTLDTWFSSGLWTFSTLGWPTTEFTVMRHGEAEHNIQAILDTTNEGKFSLTSKGRKQVEAAAKKLKSSGIELIIASPFTRTQETAEIVAKTLGVEIITDDRLREVGGNDMHGKPVGDYMNMRKAPGGWDGTNGLESFTELKSRVTEFFKDTLQKYPNKKILIVSHGDPIRVMRSHTTADLYTEKLLLDQAGVETVSIDYEGTIDDL